MDTIMHKEKDHVITHGTGSEWIQGFGGAIEGHGGIGLRCFVGFNEY